VNACFTHAQFHDGWLCLLFTAYTDEYEGQKRDVEIGVLFGNDDSIAAPVRLLIHVSLHPTAECVSWCRVDIDRAIRFLTDCLHCITTVRIGYPQLNAAYRDAGFDSRLNEPWSGQQGFMYSAEQAAAVASAAIASSSRAAPAPGSRALMLEFRNDLLLQPEWRKRVMALTAGFLRARALL
jgi:predicted N-formylglutamate amidohydrolase